MSRRLALAAVMLGAVAVAGCGQAEGVAKPAATAKAVASVAASPTPTELTSDQSVYVDAVRTIYPGVTDDELLKLGKSTCEALDSGVPMADIANAANELTKAERFTLLAATTVALCPAHGDAYEAWRKSFPPTVDDGTWTVGADIPAGRYRVMEIASADCYWSITRTGSNGDDILNNNIGGGRPQVTLKVGQDFETARCGSWEKF